MLARLVSHQNPEAVETPLLLLADLRDIDRTAELCYAGLGVWWLGAVSDNTERHARAEAMVKMLDLAERDMGYVSPRTRMLCKLNLQGFALIEAYHGRDPNGVMLVAPGPDQYETTILADFQWRDREWRTDQGSAVVKERLLHTLNEPQRIEADAQIKQFLANDGRDQYRRIMQGRTSFGYGGMTGGTRSLSL